MNLTEDYSEKVISQVNQLINDLKEESQEKIPVDFRRFFQENDTHKEEYKLDLKNLKETDLEKETIEFLAYIGTFLGTEIQYENLEPSWKNLENEGKIKDAAIKLEEELAKNFFNISNTLSDRKMTDVKFIYNIRYFGRTDDENKAKELKVFKDLCNVFCLMHEKYEKEENYEEMLNSYKIIYDELNKIM